MALPKPVWSGDDIEMAGRKASSLIWDAWNKDPTKMAVLRAIDACQARLNHNEPFDWEIGMALAQRYVCSYLPIFIERGGSALLTLFRSSPLTVLGSGTCSDLLLAMLQRETNSWGVPIQHVVPFGASCGVMHAKSPLIVLTFVLVMPIWERCIQRTSRIVHQDYL